MGFTLNLPANRNTNTNIKMITQAEANKLADLIRQNTKNFSDGSHTSHSIMWAVNYHLPLVLWGIEKPIDLVNALVIAAFTGTDPSICGALGLDRSLEIGSPLFEKDYSGELRIDRDNQPMNPLEL